MPIPYIISRCLTMILNLILHSNSHGDFNIELNSDFDIFSDDYELPTANNYIYNDNQYTFEFLDKNIFINEFIINDEIYDIESHLDTENSVKIILKDKKPFLDCFGAVKIVAIVNGIEYRSDNLAVLVSKDKINNNVINMVDFIYNHCEKYLYEEHKNSKISTGIKPSEIVSLEYKLKVLDEVKNAYVRCFGAINNNPYKKLIQTDKVDTFNNLQSVSPKTMQYIIQHTDELVPVNYNSGIRSNKQFYQPVKTLVKSSCYSKNVYENYVLVGFLVTALKEIQLIKDNLQEIILYYNNEKEYDEYINSFYCIFTKSINAIKEDYLERVNELLNSFRIIYHNYSKSLGVKGEKLKYKPNFTLVFKSIMPYRLIYQTINKWFSCGNYDLGKDELLLSFLSISKIYEYYCLTKLLYFIDKDTDFEYIDSENYKYDTSNKYNNNIRCNNTFYFKSGEKKITVYFQPSIFDNLKQQNNINLYRNTTYVYQSPWRQIDNSEYYHFLEGHHYTPDYIIKLKYQKKTKYIILDAKFQSLDNVKKYAVQECVFKYLFSISTFNYEDNIIGLYLLCGKTTSDDCTEYVNNISRKFNLKANPFVKLLVISGNDTENIEALKSIIEDF